MGYSRGRSTHRADYYYDDDDDAYEDYDYDYDYASSVSRPSKHRSDDRDLAYHDQPHRQALATYSAPRSTVSTYSRTTRRSGDYGSRAGSSYAASSYGGSSITQGSGSSGSLRASIMQRGRSMTRSISRSFRGRGRSPSSSSYSRSRSRSRSVVSFREHSRTRSTSVSPATRGVLKSALTAGAVEAFRLRNSSAHGKGRRVATAAIGAVVLGTVLGKQKGMVKSAVAGMITNRLVNGKRR